MSGRYSDRDVGLLEAVVRAICHDIDELDRQRDSSVLERLPKTAAALDRWAEESEAIRWQYDERGEPLERVT